MITKNSLIAAIRGGMDPDEIYVLLDEATREIEAEKDKEMRTAALMDGMMAYVGRDHKLWNHMDPYDALESVMYILDDFMAMDSPVANATKEKCSCGEDCSCDKSTEKNVAKMVIVDKNGKTERELTAEEADAMLKDFLSFIM